MVDLLSERRRKAKPLDLEVMFNSTIEYIKDMIEFFRWVREVKTDNLGSEEILSERVHFLNEL